MKKVADLKPHPWGLNDMHENVGNGYTEKPPSADDPVVASGSRCVIRGGGWGGDAP